VQPGTVTPVKPLSPFSPNYIPPRYVSPNYQQQTIDLLTQINTNLKDIKELLKK